MAIYDSKSLNLPLREEIISKRDEIYTNQMVMSVGELISLYSDEEINLEPAFQRIFRWTEQQETNFIESILLGYPIPSIFVLQREDGVWDVIDGVQRLSTIYHFVGILRNSDRQMPLKLKEGKILKELKDVYYNHQYESSFDTSSRIDFKRAIIPVIIIKHNSDKASKLELFKRLNTGGTHLSDQEVRNALMLMSNEEAFLSLEKYCKNDFYTNFINLSDNKNDSRMDMDILTRFIVMKNYPNIDSVDNSLDINDFLDEAICDLISSPNYDVQSDLKTFDQIIKFLSENIDECYGFQVYNQNKEKFQGGFNWVIFETCLWGLGVINDTHILENYKEEIVQKIKNLKGTGEFLKSKGKSNVKVIQRLKMAKIEAEEVFQFE